MKRITVAFGLFLAVSTFAAVPCFAATAAATAAAPEAAKKAEKKTGTYIGEVMEIDQKAKKILVAPKNSEIAMVLNTSKVKKGLDEVKVGDWVVATFEAKVGTLYALKVAKAKKPEESKNPGLKKDAPRQKPANHP